MTETEEWIRKNTFVPHQAHSHFMCTNCSDDIGVDWTMEYPGQKVSTPEGWNWSWRYEKKDRWNEITNRLEKVLCLHTMLFCPDCSWRLGLNAIRNLGRALIEAGIAHVEVLREMFYCVVCQGSGELEIYDEKVTDDMVRVVDMKIKCPTCLGSGWDDGVPIQYPKAVRLGKGLIEAGTYYMSWLDSMGMFAMKRPYRIKSK